MELFFSILLGAMFFLGAFSLMCAGIAAEQHKPFYGLARGIMLFGLALQGLAIWGAFLLY